MRKRPLGKTGVEVSELALGTWGLSGDGYGAIVEAEADRVIDAALAAGITLFETADAYGKGAFESKLGERLPKGTVFVATKLGTDRSGEMARKRFEPQYLEEALDASAARLKRQVDIVMLHNPSVAAIEKGEACPFLREQKNVGKVRVWGVSAGSAQVAMAAIEKGAEVVELAYNLFLPSDLHAVSSEAFEKGVGVLARSALAHGLLAGHWTAEREFYPGDHRADRWTREELRVRVGQLDGMREIAAKYVLTLRAAALRFVLANDLVSAVVLGPRSVAQLEQLIREAGMGPPYLRDTMLAEISTRLETMGIPLVTAAAGSAAELDELVRIARAASAIVMEVYATKFAVAMKSPGDPVTEADQRANDLLCREIARAFPGEAIVAEEDAARTPAEMRALTARERVFFVDPLDGTREFAARRDEFSVMIGVAVHGRAALGVLVLPTTGEVLFGDARAPGTALIEAHDGARTPLRVSPLRDPAEARLVVSRSRRPSLIAPMTERLGIRTVIACGSVGVKVARVAMRAADLYVHAGGGIKSWDLCGPEALLVAAGGCVTTLGGEPVDYSGDIVHMLGFVGSNGALHNDVLAAIAAAPG